MLALSSMLTPATSAAEAGSVKRSSSRSLKAILDPLAAERGARAARRVALHVDGDRIHGDVSGGSLDVHREGGRVAAQALRTDAEHVDRLRQLALEPRALGVFAARADGSGRGDLGKAHAQVGGPADADADDGRRAGLAAGV